MPSRPCGTNHVGAIGYETELLIRRPFPADEFGPGIELRLLRFL